MEAVLEAAARDSFGKNEARRTRHAGRVPGVLYGEGKDATPISVEPRALLRILHSESGANTLISLKLAGAGDTRVLVKDFQLDPVTHQVLHADFYRVAMDKALEVTVPVTIKGEPKGVKQQGGILEFIRREIVVSCLPADIPEHIEVDISSLELGETVRLQDVAAISGVTFLDDAADTVIANCSSPRGLTEAEEAADEALAAEASAESAAAAEADADAPAEEE